MSKQVRVRFAPSPTGHLHIGSLRAALFNWLFARHNNGVFLLRIEDTDLERSTQEFTESILSSLAWVDIQPDEKIVIQSQRIKEHALVVHQLLATGKAYKCYCSQDEVRLRAHDELFTRYDGTCKNLPDKLGVPYVVRFKIPDITEVVFDDIIRGRVSFGRDQLDDFIITRSDGSPMYNFVVVVDDAHMGITHVIRGEDHISNTPKQILLYQACGFTVPQFAHLPLILGPNGDKLSKRDAAVSVMEYKEQGYLPDALLNYLVRLGWSHGDQELFTREELIQYFTLDAVGKKGSIFDMHKLQWMNGTYIRTMSAPALITYIEKNMHPAFAKQFSAWDVVKLNKAIDLYKERVVTVVQLMDDLKIMYAGPDNYNEQDIMAWVTPEIMKHMNDIISLLSQESGHIFDALKSYAKKIGVKPVQLMQPMRIALIGSSTGPGVGELVDIIGTGSSIERIRALQQRV